MTTIVVSRDDAVDHHASPALNRRVMCRGLHLAPALVSPCTSCCLFVQSYSPERRDELLGDAIDHPALMPGLVASCVLDLF